MLLQLANTVHPASRGPAHRPWDHRSGRKHKAAPYQAHANTHTVGKAQRRVVHHLVTVIRRRAVRAMKKAAGGRLPQIAYTNFIRRTA